MTRKDYVIIARAVKHGIARADDVGEHDVSVSSEIVRALVSELADDNPRFDSERFRKAIYNY